MGVPVPLPKKTAVHILPKAANMIRSQKCRLVRLVGYSSPEDALLCTRHSRRHGAVILQQLHVNSIHESTICFRGSRFVDVRVREDGDRPCCCGHRTRKPGPHRLLSKQSARGLVNARVDITACRRSNGDPTHLSMLQTTQAGAVGHGDRFVNSACAHGKG